MKILTVAPAYPPEGGGLERYAQGVLKELVRRGHEVTVLACTRGPSQLLMQDGVLVHRLHTRLWLGNMPVAARLRPTIGRTVRDFRPDVVVAHTPVPYAAEMAYLAARRHGVPFVLTYHAGRLQSNHRVLAAGAAANRWTLERRMLAGADGLIAVGPYVRDHALAEQRARVAVIPPGVDADRFRPAAAAPPGQDILFVGPLASSYAWKGIDVLWAAMQRLARTHPGARLVIAGDGDRRHEFEQKARLAGGRLLVLGRVNESELVARYRRAAAVVLPSTTDAEAFGMVLAEANACGRPVVGSAVGGIPDFVRHGDNGYLVPPGDASALAEALADLLANPRAATAMGQRGRQRVVREHAWAALATATERALHAATEARVGADVVAPALTAA